MLDFHENVALFSHLNSFHLLLGMFDLSYSLVEEAVLAALTTTWTTTINKVEVSIKHSYCFRIN